MEFNLWEEPLHSFMWRPFRSARHLDVWDSLIRWMSALHFSAMLFAIHVLANAAQQHLLCCGTPYSRCIGPPYRPAVSSACDPGNQIEICSTCRALCLQVRSWAQGDLPAGILSGVTAQVTLTAVWSLMRWASWGACLLDRQKGMKSDLGSYFSAVFFCDTCYRLE